MNIIKEKCTKLVSIQVIVYQMPGTVSVEAVNRVCEMIRRRALHWGGGLTYVTQIMNGGGSFCILAVFNSRVLLSITLVSCIGILM